MQLDVPNLYRKTLVTHVTFTHVTVCPPVFTQLKTWKRLASEKKPLIAEI